MFNQFQSVSVVVGEPRCFCPLTDKWLWIFSNAGCKNCTYCNGISSKDWGKIVACGKQGREETMEGDVIFRDSPYRAFCPMQKDWISVKGNKNSCSVCPYINKVRYQKKDVEIECKWTDRSLVYDFDKQSFGDGHVDQK